MQADAHTLAVEQMRLGDHAFAHYADDNVRWQVPAVFTRSADPSASSAPFPRRGAHPFGLMMAVTPATS